MPQASEEIQGLYDLRFRTETLDKLKQLEFHSIICMEDGVTCLSIWVEEEKVMLVLNIRYKKIFSYCMETVPQRV